ncbi:phosphoribosyltransferase [Shewanella oncorhynchi]|uniref:phosphoribosyltransferase n=1 Tax=Shewanella oncorhynchi TaxID=2726434 RepID=UPI003D7BC1AD
MQAQAPFDEGENWSRDHIWSHGGNLFRRIANKTTIKGSAFWFSGDVHRQEHTNIDDNRILIVTGSCNALENFTSAIMPQVRVISTIEKQSSRIYEYQFIGHNRKGLEGNWVQKENSAVNVGSTKSIEGMKQFSSSQTSPEISTSTSTITITNISTLQKCDEGLESEIHSEIINKKIYKFGRFDTCRDVTSLSWISITPLLDCRSIYKKIINQFKDKIENIAKRTNNKSDCLLIGIDHWGAILSARLGAATNIRSCSVAIRGKSGSYDEHEIINSKLSNIVKGKKFIFVISDVISTGNSMSSAINKLKGDNDSWYGFTVICDPQQNRGDNLIKYKDIFYICGSLRMPIINANLLPDKQILNTEISFFQ